MDVNFLELVQLVNQSGGKVIINLDEVALIKIPNTQYLDAILDDIAESMTPLDFIIEVGGEILSIH